MKQLIILAMAVLAISCDSSKNAPLPKETGELSKPEICLSCQTETGAENDSVYITVPVFDVPNIIFREEGHVSFWKMSPHRFRTKLAFYSFLKKNAPKYDNNLMVYISRGDTALFCYKQGVYTPDSRLPIMSASKPVTAAVIMSLVEAGKLSLDDKVSKYIASFNNEKKSITIRQLLTHTSGIVVESTYDTRHNITLRQNIDSIALKTKLQFTPGSRSLYGSVAYSDLLLKQWKQTIRTTSIRSMVWVFSGLR